MTFTHDFLRAKQPAIENFLDGVAKMEPAERDTILARTICEDDIAKFVPLCDEKLVNLFEFFDET